MIIPNLQPFSTQLCRIKEIPDHFFKNLESAKSFDNSLFPTWLRQTPVIFGERTDLKKKFRTVYTKYKAINNSNERRKIITAYFDTNRIIEICNNDSQVEYYELMDIHESIRDVINDTFSYLYHSALRNAAFEHLVNDNVKSAIKKFLDANELEICPFCGLEMALILDGQGRLALDHWLNKERFPFGNVNFANLIPIGSDCNSPGVKGHKNVLKDINDINRVKAFYPYAPNNGIKILIKCTRIPDIDNVYGEWDFLIEPKHKEEQEIFDSWNFIFNISIRYKDYFNDYLLPNWKKRYVEFIKSENDVEVIHAQNVDEFKNNLKQWKRTFNVKSIPTSMIYNRFIDYLINEAPEDFLVGIVENFISKLKAEVL